MLFPFGIAPRESFPPVSKPAHNPPLFMPLCIYATTRKPLRYKCSNRIRENTYKIIAKTLDSQYLRALEFYISGGLIVNHLL